MPDAETHRVPSPGRIGRVLRLAGWNAVVLMAALALTTIAGEVWIRLTTPSMTEVKTFTFDPKAGVLYEPHTEVRVTNRIDFWSASVASPSSTSTTISFARVAASRTRAGPTTPTGTRTATGGRRKPCSRT